MSKIYNSVERYPEYAEYGYYLQLLIKDSFPLRIYSKYLADNGADKHHRSE